MITDKEIIINDFQAYFNTSFRPYDEVKSFFPDEVLYLKYLKKVLYFTKAVIEPLEKKGLKQKDTIVDIASGDGQMSLALALKGYKSITLFDMDSKRLEFGYKIIHFFNPETEINQINDSATNLSKHYDVLISYQTIEHLSDEGNYSIAKKSCQKDFLKKVNLNINKLCYFNAPNKTFPIDGHDTGKLFFHWLPMSVRKYFINKKLVKCSWSGISQPVTVSFLKRQLKTFKLSSKYYAFDNMTDYINNYPSFDYMGNKIYKINPNKLSFKKKIVRSISTLLGKNMQKLLPVLSVVFVKKNLK